MEPLVTPEHSENSAARILVLGAHPDDAEIHAGGLIVRHCQLGSQVRIISVTDGRSGHHEHAPEKLVRIRREEALAAGRRVGAEYLTWDFPDGQLFPDLELREAIIREIRRFEPDLVLTHRPYDYHPDHRATGIAVQDASYLVTVPSVCADVPALRQDPVVAYMCDLFTRPCSLRADVVLDIAAEFQLVLQMASQHRSQVFEWLPFHDGILDQVPTDPKEQLTWLADWFAPLMRSRRQHFDRQLRNAHLEQLEVYEISEYAMQLKRDSEDLSRLFPGHLQFQ